MKENCAVGFEYKFEHYVDNVFEDVVAEDGSTTRKLVKLGRLVDTWTQKNLIPTAGLNHMLNVVLKGTTAVTTWYGAVYEGDYTPLATDTAASLPGDATESTAYDETTRPALVFGTVAGGAVDNSASKASFTFNATRSIRGFGMFSVSTKGGTTGTLLSVVRFKDGTGTPVTKSVDSGAVLQVTAGISLTSS